MEYMYVWVLCAMRPDSRLCSAATEVHVPRGSTCTYMQVNTARVEVQE